MQTKITHYCELIGGPLDGHKYTEDNFHEKKFMLLPNGKYAIYNLVSGMWDHAKSMHFNKLGFTGYQKSS